MGEKKLIVISDGGVIEHIYTEQFDLTDCGDSQITRASHVEPSQNGDGSWYVDLAPIGGEVVHGFSKRSEALQYEEERVNQWLKQKSK